MKIFLLLAYKEAVVLTAEQMDRLKEATVMFCMDSALLNLELPKPDVGLDVKPGRVMDSPQKPPPPLMAKPSYPSGAQPQRRMSPSMINRAQGQQGVVMQHAGKPQTAVRTGLHQNVGPQTNNVQNFDDPRDDDSDGSEESNFTFQLQGYGAAEGQVCARAYIYMLSSIYIFIFLNDKGFADMMLKF